MGSVGNAAAAFSSGPLRTVLIELLEADPPLHLGNFPGPVVPAVVPVVVQLPQLAGAGLVAAPELALGLGPGVQVLVIQRDLLHLVAHRAPALLLQPNNFILVKQQVLKKMICPVAFSVFLSLLSG